MGGTKGEYRPEILRFLLGEAKTRVAAAHFAFSGLKRLAGRGSSDLANARVPSDDDNEEEKAGPEPCPAVGEESPFERFDPIRRRVPQEKRWRQGGANLRRIDESA